MTLGYHDDIDYLPNNNTRRQETPRGVKRNIPLQKQNTRYQNNHKVQICN